MKNIDNQKTQELIKLMEAVEPWTWENKHSKQALELIESGAGLNTQDKYGGTALMRSTMNNHADAVQALIELGADINVQDKEGWTVLMFAATEGNAEIAQALIEVGADLGLKDDDGETALAKARVDDYDDVAQLIESKILELEAKTLADYTSELQADLAHSNLSQ
ncbi:MAG: ankyrin repeat domain-containing protein [Methyloprofundus sp.]|nr:ankyrin repeat domain-containing protein [Methyloprofundus sp.]